MENGLVRPKSVGFGTITHSTSNQRTACTMSVDLALPIIPEGMTWGDYFGTDSVYSPPAIVQAYDEDGWEQVGAPKMEAEHLRPARWCRNGNACQWANCKFRHERCEHYDRWVATRGKTRGCRCQQTDPYNCKTPDEGGCKYDHRDLSKLDVFVESVPITNEADMWDYFLPLGLDGHSSSAICVKRLNKYNRALLIRSLEAAGKDVVEFEDNDTWMNVNFVN
jgi:hypothetical protein